jgi:F420-dependent oxidoreductase-like protein
MRFGYWPGTSDQTWNELLEGSRYAAATGWDGIWVEDHFMPNEDDTSGAKLECWAVMAALAMAVPDVRLGNLVCGNTYRHPTLLANIASSVDVISGGRVVLGIGAGWQENEHTAYGLEYKTVGWRMDRLEEAAQVITQLFANDKSDFDGEHYQLVDAPLEPKGHETAPRLMIAGGGEKRTMRIAAKYADEWNVWGLPSRLVQKMAVLDAHCEAVGRDPKSIDRSAAVMIDITDGPQENPEAREVPATMRGSVEQLRDIVGNYAEAGLDEIIIPCFNLGVGAERRDILDCFMTEIAEDFH